MQQFLAQFQSNKQKVSSNNPKSNQVQKYMPSFSLGQTFKIQEKDTNLCLREQLQEETKFYENQYKMIRSCICAYENNKSTDDNSRMFIQILQIMKDYVHQIVQLLKDKINYSLKQSQTQSKIDFLRKQNDKIFKAYEQKIEQVECLTSRTPQKQKLCITDIRPVTNKQNHEIVSSNKKLRQLIKQYDNCDMPLSLFNKTEDEPLKFSQISPIIDPQQPIKANCQKSHIKYFQIATKQNQNNKGDQNQILNYQKYHRKNEVKKDKSKIFTNLDNTKFD